MTKALDTGHTARRVVLDLQDTNLRKARLLKEAHDDLTDGDGDSSTAERNVVALFELIVHENVIYNRLADRDFAGAEALSMQLAAANKREARQ